MPHLQGTAVWLLTTAACFCFISAAEISAIQNGKFIAANLLELPFQAALVDPSTADKVMCSATLISPSLLLTSKDCIQGHFAIKAYLGSTIYPIESGSPYVQTRTYTIDDVTIYKDLSLLRTPFPFQTSDTLRPIPIAVSMYNITNVKRPKTSLWIYRDKLSLEYVDVRLVALNSEKDERENFRYVEWGAPLYAIDQDNSQRLMGIYWKYDRYKDKNIYFSLDKYLNWLINEIIK